MIEMMGTTRSKTSRSLEKRDRIRPIGFWSKKMMLALRIRYVTASCIFVALLSIILKRAIERIIVKSKKAAIKMQKTIG